VKKPVSRGFSSPSEAVEAWLVELGELSGPDAVRAAAVRELAAALERCPPYAIGRVAEALAALVESLERRDTSAEAARVLRGLEWLRH